MDFQVFNPHLKQLRTDGGWRVEFDVSEDQYDQIKDLPKLKGKVLILSINTDETDPNLQSSIGTDARNG